VFNIRKQSERTEKYPGNLPVEEPMEDMVIGQNRVSCNAIQKRLEHTLPPRNQSGVLFGLGLLHGVIADSLLRWYWRNNERRVQLDEVEAQRLEFGIAVSGLSILFQGQHWGVGSMKGNSTPVCIT
jgi:hypothetical protein